MFEPVLPHDLAAFISQDLATLLVDEGYCLRRVYHDHDDAGDIEVLLWRTAQGARAAIYLNMTANDPVYRELFQDVRFRRALSFAINRHEINQVVFFGLATESNNTVLAG